MIFLLFFASLAQADNFDSQVVGLRLSQLIPSGLSEGTNRRGEPCQILSGFLPLSPSKIETIRTKIYNKQTGSSASAQINFTSEQEVLGTGTLQSSLLVAVQGRSSIGAFNDGQNRLIVYVENKRTNSTEDCVLIKAQ